MTIQGSKKSLQEYLDFWYVVLLKSKSEDEESKRREFILNVLLLASIIFLLFLEGLIIYESVSYKDYNGISILSFSIICFFFITLLVASRVGYWKLASYLFLGIYFIANSYGGLTWGIELPSILLNYVVLVIMTSILLGIRIS